MNLMMNAVAEAVTPEEAAFRKIAAEMYGSDDCISKCRCSTDRGLREIVVTPVRAQYGEVSHIVLSINGSPPRGTFIVSQRYTEDIVYFRSYGRPRRLEAWRSKKQEEQYNVIVAYVRSLNDATL